eukprot:CAMPEP_0115033832 /NCGR_PEP_ID=MMETSP0216-20121206/40209_1 /TAXON_ID=223996 /ORGANISM="Protocruzia adherens, Strain Boccale" /LENGTH=201 /DNA_ID=CAMNT_0002412439 /DNA_START=35 /DNA_END=640 /DNA_ORIENTATION=-
MRYLVAICSIFLFFSSMHCAWVENYIMFNYGTQSNVALFSNAAGTNGKVLQELWSDINLSYSWAKFTIEHQSCTGSFSIKAGSEYIRAPSSKSKWVDTQNSPYGLSEFTIASVGNNWYSIKSVHGWYLSTTGREVYQKDKVTNNEKWSFMKVASGTPALFQQGSSFLRKASKGIEANEVVFVESPKDDDILSSDWQESEDK